MSDRKRDCKYVHLNSISFQAPGFIESSDIVFTADFSHIPRSVVLFEE